MSYLGLKNRRRGPCASFASDARGGVAVMFGVALVPMMLAGGMALDYARAYSVRTQMRAAADGAALQMARMILDGRPDAIPSGEAFVHAALVGSQVKDLQVTVTAVGEGARAEISGKIGTTLMSVIGVNEIAVNLVAEANTSAGQPGGLGNGGVSLGGEEIALALDVTGSMANDMDALRATAMGFVDKVMDGKRRVAIVPFVAAVNVGSANLAMAYMDTKAENSAHASRFRNMRFGYNPKCSNTAGKTPGTPSPGNGKTGSLQGTGSSRFAGIVQELFGIQAAMADVTPSTKPIVPGYDKTAISPKAPPGSTHYAPAGWDTKDGCFIYNPKKVSHFDLFARIPGAKWKGCVEARPEPYDVTDDVPVKGAPNSFFVPYFAPDEPGTGKDPFNPKPIQGATYHNDYLPDSTYMADGTMHPAGEADESPVRGFNYKPGSDGGDRVANILKYDEVTAPVASGLKESPPVTFGPNRACPDEMLRLTADKSAAKAKIASLSHWFGGGTIGSEGVAWAWRAISPSAPFSDGSAYTKDKKKNIVLMTDGLNLMDANGINSKGSFDDSAVFTDWTAYGYLRDNYGRLGPTWPNNFEAATDYLNSRMAAVCENAKAKGVTIYTILFRETDPRAINVVRNCASDPEKFFHATTQADLKNSFGTIAQNFTSPLRLTK